MQACAQQPHCRHWLCRCHSCTLAAQPLRILTPRAAQRAALQKQGRPQPLAVMGRRSACSQKITPVIRLHTPLLAMISSCRSGGKLRKVSCVACNPDGQATVFFRFALRRAQIGFIQHVELDMADAERADRTQELSKLPDPRVCLEKRRQELHVQQRPLLALRNGRRATDCRSAVGPLVSRPYMAETPPSASGSPARRPSADAPTFCPMGTCAETV